ncbi:hypothetical protein [Parvularcula lutaonensis]|uniref:Flp pilus assembly protein CpaB n=1 Tax=Parvularcula lutaonensis TaxID=491923 RepID=A0ABV7MGQ8_9PROT|nr:hypothetical protein [Parvularcula lutaonensis]
MRRRLSILLIDTFVLTGLALVGAFLFRLETSPTQAAESSAEVKHLQASTEVTEALPRGVVQVSARVVPEPSRDIIMPGDRVDLAKRPGAPAVLADARVLSIEPPLMEGDDRLHITFALETTDASRLRDMREVSLLFVRLAQVGTNAPAQASFEPLRKNEVLNLHFEDAGWQRRIEAY